MTDNRHAQPGTGSAENKNEDRTEQVNRVADLSQEDLEKIAEDIGVPGEAVISVRDMGMLSGRDDQAGGDSDRMERENTGGATDR